MSWVRDAANETLSFDSFSVSTTVTRSIIFAFQSTASHAQNIFWVSWVAGAGSSRGYGEIRTDGTDQVLTRVREGTGTINNTSVIGLGTFANQWRLFGAHVPAFTGASVDTKTSWHGTTGTTSTTYGTTDHTINEAYLGHTAGDGRGKYAHVGWYTGLTAAQFQTLYDTMYNSGGAFKSHTHPDVTALGHSPICVRTLLTDGSSGSGLTVTNNGGSFDGADNPTMASEGGGGGSTGNRLIMW